MGQLSRQPPTEQHEGRTGAETGGGEVRTASRRDGPRVCGVYVVRCVFRYARFCSFPVCSVMDTAVSTRSVCECVQ